MGILQKLFGTGKKPEPEVAMQVTIREPGENVWVNMTEKNVKVPVVEGQQYTEYEKCYLWQEEKLIRGLQGEKVLFEVTSRSKTFKELEPYARRKARYVRFSIEQGEYGNFYRAHFVFDKE